MGRAENPCPTWIQKAWIRSTKAKTRSMPLEKRRMRIAGVSIRRSTRVRGILRTRQPRTDRVAQSTRRRVTRRTRKSRTWSRDRRRDRRRMSQRTIDASPIAIGPRSPATVAGDLGVARLAGPSRSWLHHRSVRRRLKGHRHILTGREPVRFRSPVDDGIVVPADGGHSGNQRANRSRDRPQSGRQSAHALSAGIGPRR
jgi:hypothetical protein